jgi:hypothetical protein
MQKMVFQERTNRNDHYRRMPSTLFLIMLLKQKILTFTNEAKKLGFDIPSFFQMERL